MTFNILEQILIKLSFVIYFLVTLCSWSRIAIYEKKNQVKSPSNKNFLLWKKNESFFGIFLGFVIITSLCLIRWNISDHLPLSNLYESSLFLSWSFIFLYLIFKIKIDSDWLDAILAPIILMTTTFSTLGLPKQLQQATSLVPALQSNWLMMHVTMMILSYGSLILGSLLAVSLLTLSFFRKKNFSKNVWNSNSTLNQQMDFLKNFYIFEPRKEVEKTKLIDFQQSFKARDFEKTKVKKKVSNSVPKSISSQNFPFEIHSNHFNFLTSIYLKKNKTLLINQIDYWSYRIIGIGFPLLTLGILSGAVWANEAWGSYWNWDPKETWALITWMIFASYLHVRITKGWNGTKPALVAILGFFVVWVCYLGVNFLGKGLHSYGWLS